jgi:hypothetical protein
MQLRTLSRCALSKLLSAWFIVLILVPFTAPFKTVDWGAPAKPAANLYAKLADKLAKDAGVFSLAHQLTPGFIVLHRTSCLAVQPTVARRVAATPLRI